MNKNTFTLNGQVCEIDGSDLAQWAKRLSVEAVAAWLDKDIIMLTHKPAPGEEIRLVTLHDEEGYRIYERSLRFLFLLAVEQVSKGAKVVIDHALGRGVYANVYGTGIPGGITRAWVERVEQCMRELARQDLPFEKRIVTREEAIEYFRERGMMDKVELLTYRTHSHFTLYSCGGMMNYFYSRMVPSTGYIKVFSLHYHMPGVMLQLPVRKDPSRPANFVPQPKQQRCLAEARNWADAQGVRNVADLNRLIERGEMREFIRVCEALHEKRVADIAERIIKSGARLVLIAGPSSSGKTTFSNRLAVQLKAQSAKPVTISMDNYYIDRESIPVNGNGERDLESLDALDITLFNDQLGSLLQNQPTEVPVFNFKTGKREPVGVVTQLGSGDIIIVEGIHGLNGSLTPEIPIEMKFRVYVSALTQLNLDDHNRIHTTDVRLLRRMVRDYHTRNSSPENTLSMWPSVRAGESKNIFPFQEQADEIFNTALTYEIPILKEHIYPLLLRVPHDSPYYVRSTWLIKFLNYFKTADFSDEIPRTSILREFIGGCTFYE